MRNILISIIDDDESVRLSLASLVRSLGADTRTFASVQNFLSSGALEQSACIVSDVEMPQLSGIDMQLLLKQQGYSIPVIFITAFWSDSALSRRTPSRLRKPYFEPRSVRTQSFDSKSTRMRLYDGAAYR